MSWKQARRLLRFTEQRASNRHLGPSGSVDFSVDPLAPVRATSICIVSGKGGTGKSLVTASLACLFAKKAKTLVVDGDLGVGNAHILQDVAPDKSFIDLVNGDAALEDLVTSCRSNLDLIGAGSGIARLAGLSGQELHLIATGLERLELAYRYVVVDSAAGISNQTVSLAAASDVVVLVTTPDVTAMTDAYAFFKVLLQRAPAAAPLLVVNRVTAPEEAHFAARRLAEVSKKFLAREPRWIGNLVEDAAAHRSVQRRVPLVLSEPESRLSLCLADVCTEVLEACRRTPARGLGRTLLRYVGYVPSK